MAAALVLAANDLIKVVPGLMIWTLIAFAITFFVLRRYAFGPIQKAIDERREKIRQSIEDADRAREEAQKLLEQHHALVSQARGDAESILAESRKVADTQRERLKQELDAERARRVEETRREIEAETRRSIETIRHEVADLTLEATSKVTGKVLDDEDHRRLIEEAIGDLDFSVLEKETA
jgi:F-type H+-transporting ATPase subunit b